MKNPNLLTLKYLDGPCLRPFRFKARRKLPFYLQNAPFGAWIDFAGCNITKAMAERFSRYCRWMDRTNLVLTDNLLELPVEWRQTTWRRPKATAACLILLEPDYKDRSWWLKWVSQCFSIEEQINLKHQCYVPTTQSLYDQGSCMTFFYRPDFDYQEQVYLGDAA